MGFFQVGNNGTGFATRNTCTLPNAHKPFLFLSISSLNKKTQETSYSL